jgi:hypothetical protein
MVSAGVIGSVTVLKGGAKIGRGNDSLSVELGTNIKNRDILSTRKNSFLQVQMIDGGVVDIGENTLFGFKKYKFDYEKKANLVLQKGFFRVESGQIPKSAPDKFKIDTKSAVITAKGTDFYGLVDGNYEDIGCIDGEVFVNTQAKKFHLKAGERVVKDGSVWKKSKLPVSIYQIPKNSTLKFQRRVYRRCPNGKRWNIDVRKCVPKSRGSERATSSSKHPPTPKCNSTMVLDSTKTECICPIGKSWSKAMSMCVTDQQRVAYCNKNFPGSVPALTDRECECPNNLWWNQEWKRCVEPIKYCEEKILDSVPTITKDNKLECQCLEDYRLNKKMAKCEKHKGHNSKYHKGKHRKRRSSRRKRRGRRYSNPRRRNRPCKNPPCRRRYQ